MNTRHNRSQEHQDKVTCEITIAGGTLEEVLATPIKLDEFWADICGDSEVPLVEYIRKEAEVNATSFERSVTTALFGMGYKLEELEVDIADHVEWGKCTWYKEHEAYAKPIDKIFDGTILNDPSFYFAMFKTENAGDKNFGLYSTQMMMSPSILLHKQFRYHKIVFSPPPTKVAEESVAA